MLDRSRSGALRIGSAADAMQTGAMATYARKSDSSSSLRETALLLYATVIGDTCK